jgi:hypothetical protein
LLACVALLFLLQPLVGAAGSCTLRAKLFGSSCCCVPTPKKSCCSKRSERDAPAPKRCNCELNAPPLVPPAGASELPASLGELARALELPVALPPQLTLADTLPRGHAPPGFASCFHARLDAGMARALAFERMLRC